MNAQRIAGWVAAVSGVTILVLSAVSAIAGPSWATRGWTMGSATSGTVMGPAMMNGGSMMGAGMTGAGMMGAGSMMGGGMTGAGMMGGGMGPGMMGQGHPMFGGAARGTVGAIAGAPTVNVTATDLKFSPAEITLSGREANLTLTNKGALPHDITIPDLGVRVVAAAGQTTTVGLRDLPAGRYAGYCSVPGHADAGMRIAVTVQ